MGTKNTPNVMRGFWDEKAQENAMYYISSYRPYNEQNPEEFWKWGKVLTEQFLDESGIAFTGEESVVEIGCGIGRMTACFAERFRRVVGIDVSPHMIEQARKNLERFDNAEVHVGNGVDLSEFEDASFDFAFSYIVLQHIPDASISLNYIREAGRVLRQGGHFYFQINNMPVTWRERLGLRSRLKQLRRRLGGGGKSPAQEAGPTDLDNPAWRGSRLTVAQVTTACEAGGLRVLGLTGEGTQYMWVKAAKV